MTNYFDKQNSLIHVLEVTAVKSAKGISYAVALLGLASLVPGIQLPPELAIFASGLGVDAISNLLEKIASKDNITDDEINDEVQKIIADSEIRNLLSKDEFFHAFGHFLKKFRRYAEFQTSGLESLKAIGDTIKGIDEKIDVNIYEKKLQDNVEQLISIFEIRANFIVENLSGKYKYVNVQA
jgi:hypothetical protein